MLVTIYSIVCKTNPELIYVGSTTQYVKRIGTHSSASKDNPKKIYDFLVENEEKTYNESFLEYYGSLVSVIKDLMDVDVYSWLDFRVSDYADWTLTKKYINELFPDYI